MTPPKSIPGQFSFLQPKNKELEWPEERPGPVCEVSVQRQRAVHQQLFFLQPAGYMMGVHIDHLQHAVWFIPMQFMLYVDSSFRLNDEAGQAQEQEA